jgi:predicted HD phosphohydrolase
MGKAAQDQTAFASVVALLEHSGSVEESNEEIEGLSILHHGLQCAAVLRASHPDDNELQVAGLLHDLGHILEPSCEDRHGAIGADFVRPVFGDRVAALVEDHVPAKRYLVTVDASYRGQLSTGSARTLVLQGEAMTAEEVAQFRSSRYFDAAVELRRADEAAKDPGASVESLDTWLPTMKFVAGLGGHR